jgi:spermidine synthase
VLLVPFLDKGRERWGDVGLLAAVVAGCFLAGYEPGAEKVIWSPYQKLALERVENRDAAFPGEYLIRVNNAGYQGIIDLRPEQLASNPRINPDQYGLSQYDVPTLFKPGAGRALCVGAGSGNDVAGVLRGGARNVTAVEIDPGIVAMGRERHPERPYSDPRVRVVVDDARSHFATTDERYDLIAFGLLDSHTTTAMTNARLDHYVYTLESLRHVRSLLNDNGVVVLSFEMAKPFIIDRMSRALTEVFGWRPVTFRIPSSGAGWGGVLFVTGDEAAVRQALAGNDRLAKQVARWQAGSPLDLAHTTRITTDDWPYIYLESARIPSLYLLLAVLLVGLVGYAAYRLRAPALVPTRWDRSLWHFFFMGAAFMLLEVQNISKASVVLGNTWQVNGVIVSGVLCMILLSNLVEAVWPRLPMGLVGACLIGSCLGLYFFDLSGLAFLPYATKAVLVGLLTALPMFFSGIVFIRSFAAAEHKDVALGANLLGSLAGALVQSVTFATGIKALLLLVAALYLAALLLRPRPTAARPADEELAEPARGGVTEGPAAVAS